MYINIVNQSFGTNSMMMTDNFQKQMLPVATLKSSLDFSCWSRTIQAQR